MCALKCVCASVLKASLKPELPCIKAIMKYYPTAASVQVIFNEPG